MRGSKIFQILIVKCLVWKNINVLISNEVVKVRAKSSLEMRRNPLSRSYLPSIYPQQILALRQPWKPEKRRNKARQSDSSLHACINYPSTEIYRVATARKKSSLNCLFNGNVHNKEYAWYILPPSIQIWFFVKIETGWTHENLRAFHLL